MAGFSKLLPQKIRDMMNRAADDSAMLFPEDPAYQGKTDALRHMLITGQLAQEYGPGVARGLGAAYEALNPGGVIAQPDDALMDIHNNSIGSDLGAQTPDYASLLRAAVDRIKDAKLRPRGLGAALSDRSNAPVFLQPRRPYTEPRSATMRATPVVAAK